MANSFIAFIVLILTLALGACAYGKFYSRQDDGVLAEDLFKKGYFVEAERAFADLYAARPDDFKFHLALGYIALLSNRLDEAEQRLSRALAIKPKDATAGELLAEVFYRRDDFQRAAPLLRVAGDKAKAEKLESFKGRVPYQIDKDSRDVRLKFIMNDPLPVVQVRVNGGEPVNFFIDTGGAEVIIDTEFAKERSVTQFGTQTGWFAGGKEAAVIHGRLDSLALNDLVVENIPVQIMNTRQFSQSVFSGTRVDGVIGTVLMYHFITTLDYPKGELILRRKTDDNLHRFEQQTQRAVIAPFWMAGDHFIVARGTVNASPSMLFFVDTGLAGGGFMAPKSTIEQAGLLLRKDVAIEGSGGGGKFTSTPFTVDELTLGDTRVRNVPGFSGAFPPQLESEFGFRIGGLISHEFFKHFALTLDFNGMRLFLERSPD